LLPKPQNPTNNHIKQRIFFTCPLDLFLHQVKVLPEFFSFFARV